MSENTKTATADICITTFNAGFVWNALEKLTNEYSQEELEDVFSVETIGDLVSEWDLGFFCKKFKEYEEDREKIHVGDEVNWERLSRYEVGMIDVHAGVVLYIDDARKEYVILTYCDHFRGLYKERVSMNDKSIRKTHTHFAISSDER